MQTRNPVLDDLARVAAGALGIAAGMRKEAEELLKQRFASVIGSDGFVTREEFDAVKAMAAKARSENEALAARIAELERSLSRAAKAKPKTAGPAPKTRAARSRQTRGRGTSRKS